MSQQTALLQSVRTNKTVVTTSTVLDEVRSFFRWWYLEMPIWFLGLIQRIALVCDDTFSISLLFKTFFVPWKRDYSWVGRFFGIITRLFYLPIAIFITIITLLTLIVFVVIWALLPIITIIYLLRSPFI